MRVRRFGAGVVQLGFAFERVQTLRIATAVGVPGMADEFLNLVILIQINRMDGGDILVEDDAARHQIRTGIPHPFRGHVAERQEIAAGVANTAPFLVERCNGKQVGDVNLIDEFLHLLDDVLHGLQSEHVDCGGILPATEVRSTCLPTSHPAASRLIHLHRNGRRHATDNKVGMRVLAAKNGMQLDDITLPGKRFQVVRHGHEVGFRRQLVGRVAPVAV